MRLLNVGGSSKAIAIPSHFAGWEHLLLDIDPRGNPDIVADARELTSLAAAQFDAIYCSHNLEHYYKHHGGRVLRGFLHLLRDDGFAEIYVPDLDSLMQHVVKSGMDIEDVLYTSGKGPITPRDVLYGFGVEIERTGQDFYAHKTGFTAKSLSETLRQAGFRQAFVVTIAKKFELRAFAFKAMARPDQLALLGLQGVSLGA
jgi:SAM-dependent methyltransferase